MKSLPLKALREGAARLLAAAVLRIFPNTRLLKGGEADLGFYYDFIFDRPLGEEAFPLIEEHIRALTAEGAKVRSTTMIRENAKEFFKHKKQPFKIKTLENESEEVEILQIGDFHDVCPLPHPDELGGFRALELLSIENRHEKGLEITRITGTVFPDQKELKYFLKKLKTFKSHLEIAQEKKILTPLGPSSGDGWLFGPFASGFIDMMKGIWKDFCFDEGMEVVSSRGSDFRTLLASHAAYARASQADPPIRIAEFYQKFESVEEPRLSGLLRTDRCVGDAQNIFCRESQVSEELNSSLHFIKKWNKMLSIEGEWVLASYGKKTKRSSYYWERGKALLVEAFKNSEFSQSLPTDSAGLDFESLFVGPRLEYHYIDELGRRWLGPSLGVWTSFPKMDNLNEELKQDPLWIIGCSIFSSVERIAALLLEKGKGIVPFRLIPEQIRIFPLTEEQAGYAKEIESQCRLRGLRARIDKRTVPLSVKVEKMERDGVGFGLFIGDHEQTKNKVSVRSGYDRSEQKLIDLNVFFAQIDKDDEGR
jgi:threonyl-tRNA synthetase